MTGRLKPRCIEQRMEMSTIRQHEEEKTRNIKTAFDGLGLALSTDHTDGNAAGMINGKSRFIGANEKIQFEIHQAHTTKCCHYSTQNMVNDLTTSIIRQKHEARNIPFTAFTCAMRPPMVHMTRPITRHSTSSQLGNPGMEKATSSAPHGHGGNDHRSCIDQGPVLYGT